MADRDENGIYRIPGTQSLAISNPPDVEFRLPAEFRCDRINVFWVTVNAAPIILALAFLLFLVLWAPSPDWSGHPDKTFSWAPMFIVIPVIGLMGFLILQITNRLLAHLYVQFFEGGAKIALDRNQISDSRVCRAPIAWRDVATASVEVRRDGIFVVLRLKPGAIVSFRRFRLDQRIFNSILRPRGGKTVEISTETLNVDPSVLARLISAVAEDNKVTTSA
jgi:hypothetical protein